MLTAMGLLRHLGGGGSRGGGDEKALKMAIEHRRKMMKKIHGDDFYEKSD